MMSRRRRSRWFRLLAALVVLGLIAAACSGGDDSDAGGDDTSDPEDPEADDDAMMEPVYGGEISFLLEAETQTWDLPNAECATSCINVFRLVADALWAIDESGLAQPMLLESADANADFTEWTLTMRPNISFHDGTPADATALARDLDEKAHKSFLHSQVLVDLLEITVVDDLTVVVTFAAPFSDLPELMSDRVGFLMAPAFWDMTASDRGLGGPIGTGAFVFGDWSLDERLILDRNPNYWRTDSEGRQLPYLDRVIMRPVPNQTDREAFMQSGAGSITHLSNTENPAQWTDDWDAGLLTDELTQQVSYLQLNNSVPPFDDIRARRAIAYCSDLETFNLLRNPASTTANGPFSPGRRATSKTPAFRRSTQRPEPRWSTSSVDSASTI